MDYFTRIKMLSTLIVVSLLLVAFASYYESQYSFAITVLGVVLVGAQQSIGECTIMGFIHLFPSRMVGYFSSGTGLAGIFGSLYFLVLPAFGIGVTGISLIALLNVLPFGYAFKKLYLDRQEIEHINPNGDGNF